VAAQGTRIWDAAEELAQVVDQKCGQVVIAARGARTLVLQKLVNTQRGTSLMISYVVSVLTGYVPARVKNGTSRAIESFTSTAQVASQQLSNQVLAVRIKASSVGVHARRVITEPATKVTAASAASGAAVLGASGGAVGFTVGAGVGACLGVIPAVFTFGLSVPIGAAIGAGTGLCAGTTIGGAVGLASGGAVGYGAYSKRESIRDGSAAVSVRVVNSAAYVQERAATSKQFVQEHAATSKQFVQERAATSKQFVQERAAFSKQFVQEHAATSKQFVSSKVSDSVTLVKRRFERTAAAA
jgi:hypothetical protein